MRPLAFRFLLPAAFVVFATDAALSGAAVGRIEIICDPATGVEICEGLHAAIAQRFPTQQVAMADGHSASVVTALRPITQQDRSGVVSGYLTWTTAAGHSGQSQPIELSVMDTTLTSEMLREFGATLATFFTPNS